MTPASIISCRSSVPMRGEAALNEQNVGSISSARSSVCCIVSAVSPGRPSTNVAKVVMSSSRAHANACRISESFVPFS